MKPDTFPYSEFQNTPAWEVLENAIERLVINNDLVERTNRRYIVGSILKTLNENKMLSAVAVLKPMT